MARVIAEQAKGSPAGGRMSVTAVFAALILCLLLLLAVVIGLLIWREYHSALSQGDERAEGVAQTAAEHARWLIEANMSILSRVDDALGEETDWQVVRGAYDASRFSEFVPAGSSIRVVDAAGITVFTSDLVNSRIDVSDRDYFAALAAGQRTYISRLITDRATGERLFIVARRIERGGEFAGVISATVPIRGMASFWMSLGLGPGSSVGLINDEGWQVARHPVPEEALNLMDHILFTELLPRAPSGHYRNPGSPVDGVARFVGYHRVPGLPLIASVGISQDVVLSDFRRNTLFSLAVGIPLLILLAIVSIWGLRWLRREERTQAKLGHALEQNQMLLREIHHRVKNNLQVVASLISLQPGAPEAKAEMVRRISAMADTYEHIYRGDHFDRVDLSEHLPAIIDGLKEGYQASAGIEYDLEPLSVSSDTVLPLTLIATEVVGNALKHAFPEGRPGRVTVSLHHQDGRASLTIADDGEGMDTTRQSNGLGMKLLSAFSRQIEGEYSFDLPSKGGTEFVLSFPLGSEEPPDALPPAP